MSGPPRQLQSSSARSARMNSEASPIEPAARAELWRRFSSRAGQPRSETISAQSALQLLDAGPPRTPRAASAPRAKPHGRTRSSASPGSGGPTFRPSAASRPRRRSQRESRRRDRPARRRASAGSERSYGWPDPGTAASTRTASFRRRCARRRTGPRRCSPGRPRPARVRSARSGRAPAGRGPAGNERGRAEWDQHPRGGRRTRRSGRTRYGGRRSRSAPVAAGDRPPSAAVRLLHGSSIRVAPWTAPGSRSKAPTSTGSRARIRPTPRTRG